MVIKALGFDPEELPHLFGSPDLSVTRWGTLRVDHQTMMTSLPGVFAAGDIVRGASLVVWGIRDGRDVSEQMSKWLKAKAKSEKRKSQSHSRGRARRVGGAARGSSGHECFGYRALKSLRTS